MDISIPAGFFFFSIPFFFCFCMWTLCSDFRNQDKPLFQFWKPDFATWRTPLIIKERNIIANFEKPSIKMCSVICCCSLLYSLERKWMSDLQCEVWHFIMPVSHSTVSHSAGPELDSLSTLEFHASDQPTLVYAYYMKIMPSLSSSLSNRLLVLTKSCSL